jgi:predicted RNA polymerase sigma factor
LLYEGLIQLSPTLGALVSWAAAIAEVKGIDLGLATLNTLDMETVKIYQPYWALKAHLLKQLGRNSEARQAYSRAIGLTEDAAIREFLLHQSIPLGE